jgi:hypothetical protein
VAGIFGAPRCHCPSFPLQEPGVREEFFVSDCRESLDRMHDRQTAPQGSFVSPATLLAADPVKSC